MNVNSLAHTKWECKYHIVFAPKYRRQVIYKDIKADVGQILGSLCRRKGIEIIEAECRPDHIHMLVRIPPKYSVSEIVGYLKGIYDASFAIEKLKTHNQEKWKESDYDALTNIIMAIVLWDNVCIFPEYCNSIYIDGVKYFNQYKNMFSVIKPKSGYVDLLPDDIKKLEEEYFFHL